MKQKALVGTKPCRYLVGQSMTVWYNPKKPSEIMIEGDHMLKRLADIFTIVAAVILSVGIIGGVIAYIVGA